MKVNIRNVVPGIIPTDENGYADVCRVFSDPSGKYAVLEVFPCRLFVAVRAAGSDGDVMIGDYVNHCYYDDEPPRFLSFSVEWEWLRFGFCKLTVSDPDMCVKHGGMDLFTVARFYFDEALYRASYEEINGVPCPKEKKEKKEKKKK